MTIFKLYAAVTTTFLYGRCQLLPTNRGKSFLSSVINSQTQTPPRQIKQLSRAKLVMQVGRKSTAIFKLIFKEVVLLIPLFLVDIIRNYANRAHDLIFFVVGNRTNKTFEIDKI